MNRPTVLLYDWDNTLVDAWAGVTVALNAAFGAFGLPQWTVEQARERLRASLRDSFPVIFGPRWTHARDLFYAALSRQHLEHLRPMEGAEDALRMGAAWPQGVVSNKTGRFLRAEVQHLGWSPHFRSVIGAGDARADKPAPDSILLALSELGVSADRTVWYLGDTASDVQAARAAGVTAVLVGDAAHDGGIAHVDPDMRIPSASALASLLRELA